MAPSPSLAALNIPPSADPLIKIAAEDDINNILSPTSFAVSHTSLINKKKRNFQSDSHATQVSKNLNNVQNLDSSKSLDRLTDQRSALNVPPVTDTIQRTSDALPTS